MKNTRIIAMNGYRVKVSLVQAAEEKYAAVSVQKLAAPWATEEEPHLALISLTEGS